MFNAKPNTAYITLQGFFYMYTVTQLITTKTKHATEKYNTEKTIQEKSENKTKTHTLK